MGENREGVGKEASHQGRKRGQGQYGVQEDRCTRKSRQCWCRCRSGKDPPHCTRPRLQDRASETQAHLPLCLISQATPSQFPSQPSKFQSLKGPHPIYFRPQPFLASPASSERFVPITIRFQRFLTHPYYDCGLQASSKASPH